MGKRRFLNTPFVPFQASQEPINTNSDNQDGPSTSAQAGAEHYSERTKAKAYEWTADLETGNRLIDQEHHELIDAINRLLDACARGQGRAEIEATLEFLSDYITRHFRDEESLQRRYGYPDFANHKRYHEGFKKSVAEIVKEFENGGANVALVSKVNQVIAGWLINHIKKEDKKVAAHIRQQEAL